MLVDLPDPFPIEPLRGPIERTVTVPGSKSLTCRAYVLAALAEGASRLEGPLRADDTDRLLAALLRLGAEARWAGGEVTIHGVGGRFPDGGRVDLGDGGAPARFMMAAGALAGAPVVVDGSPRLRERPVSEMVELLAGLGVRAEYLEREGRLPVRIMPADSLRGGRLEVGPVRSSQFVSALLLIAPFLADGLEIVHTAPVPSRGYTGLTMGVLRDWGVDADEHVERGLDVQSVPAARVRGRPYAIEPDASSATYWLAAGSVAPAGSRVRICRLGSDSLQPDARFASEALAPMGATVRVEAAALEVEARGTLRGGLTLDMASMPDAALALAAVAATAKAPTTIRGLETLPVKESDRLAALATELGRIGCAATATAESITVDPRPRHARPVSIETYRDHRLAMAFAVLGLARGGISIKNPACVSKSYPGFWDDLRRFAAAG